MYESSIFIVVGVVVDLDFVLLFEEQDEEGAASEVVDVDDSVLADDIADAEGLLKVLNLNIFFFFF